VQLLERIDSVEVLEIFSVFALLFLGIGFEDVVGLLSTGGLLSLYIVLGIFRCMTTLCFVFRLPTLLRLVAPVSLWRAWLLADLFPLLWLTVGYLKLDVHIFALVEVTPVF
jgi:hypothetical protein